MARPKQPTQPTASPNIARLGEQPQAAIASKDAVSIRQAQGTGDPRFPLDENLKGAKEINLPAIKIAHQGGIFLFPPDDRGEKSFAGVVLDHHSANLFWKESMSKSGAGKPPDCFSSDAFHVEPSAPEPQAENCGVCPNAKFGSEILDDGSAGRGKACKNIKKILLFVPGENIPKILCFSPLNIRHFENYMMSLSDRSLHYSTVITEFNLTKATSKSGFSYQQIVLAPKAKIDEEGLDTVSRLRTEYRTLFRKYQIDSADIHADESGENAPKKATGAVSKPSSADIASYDDEDEIPF